jgi:AcrR family transcriptional regulator
MDCVMSEVSIRKVRNSASDKRIRILDAAEALFAEKDFDGTNVRKIATAAEVPLSLVSYHFPTKLELYEAVIARRADVISGERFAALEAARTEKGDALDIRDVLGAYAAPFIRRSTHRSSGWRNYCQLIARVGTSRRWQPIVGKYFDATSEVFTAELEALYPGTPPQKLHQGFYLMIGAMLLMCADTGRLVVMSGDHYTGSSPDEMVDEFLTFASSGFQALALLN